MRSVMTLLMQGSVVCHIPHGSIEASAQQPPLGSCHRPSNMSCHMQPPQQTPSEQTIDAAPAPATPLTPSAIGGNAPSPGIPAGLEGYLKTDAPSPGSAGALSPAAAPAAPISTHDTAFSPTPLPAAITPASTPGLGSPPAPAPPAFDANPMPSPPTPANPEPVFPPRSSATAAPAKQAAAAAAAAAPAAGERVLQPGAFEAPYTGSDEDIVRSWIKDLTGQDLSGEPSLQEALKSGVILCGLVNRIVPGRIKKVQNSNMPFPQVGRCHWFFL